MQSHARNLWMFQSIILESRIFLILFHFPVIILYYIMAVMPIHFVELSHYNTNRRHCDL